MLATDLRPRRLAAAALAVLATAGAAGCASSGGGDTDPAAFVPAGAPLYAEALARPGTDAQAALGKLLGTNDPGGALATLFDRRARAAGLVWARDVEPWLGDRVAVAKTAAGPLLVAAATDEAAARQALERARPGAEQREHSGVAYGYLARDRSAAAVFGGAVVIGSEAGLKAAIDAAQGDSLAESDVLERARDAVAADRVGFVYVDVARAARDALGGAGAGAGGQAGAMLGLFADALPGAIGAALQAQADALRVDAVALGGPDGTDRGDAGADALAALPAGAWLGIGVGGLGDGIAEALKEVGGSGLGGVAVEAALAQAGEQLGLDVRRDLLAWMGDAALFASGTGESAGGALVVRSSDPAATRRAVRALERLARAEPAADVRALTVDGVDEGFRVRGAGAHHFSVAAGGDRFVIAVGDDALRAALRPGERLDDTAAFREAARALGGGLRPQLFLDAQRLAAAGGDAGLREHLEPFGAIAAGARREDDLTRIRGVATLP